MLTPNVFKGVAAVERDVGAFPIIPRGEGHFFVTKPAKQPDYCVGG